MKRPCSIPMIHIFSFALNWKWIFICCAPSQIKSNQACYPQIRVLKQTIFGKRYICKNVILQHGSRKLLSWWKLRWWLFMTPTEDYPWVSSSVFCVCWQAAGVWRQLHCKPSFIKNKCAKKEMNERPTQSHYRVHTYKQTFLKQQLYIFPASPREK